MKHERRHKIAQEVVGWFFKQAGIQYDGGHSSPMSFKDLCLLVSGTFRIAVQPVAGLDIGKVRTSLKRLDVTLDPAVDGEYSALAGFLYARDGGGVIFINQSDSEERRKFSLAHELGHFINDYYRPVFLKYEAGGTMSLFEGQTGHTQQVISARCTNEDVFGNAEREVEDTRGRDRGGRLVELHREQKEKFKEIKANLFAAELLMPIEECRKVEHENSVIGSEELVRVIMERFGVSRAAARVRVRELRLGVVEEGLW